MVNISVRARPIVVRNQQFPVLIGATGYTLNRFGSWTSLDEVRVDGHLRDVHSFDRFPPGSDCFAGTLTFAEPGRHVIAATLSFAVYSVTRGSGEVDAPAHCAGRRTVSAEVRVLEEETADLIKLTHTPKLDATVLEAINRITARSERGWVRIDLEWRGPVPIALAFEATVQSGGAGREVSLGEITARPGQGRWVTTEVFSADDAPDKVTVILRSSKSVAAETFDLYEIWDGELRFENVPVLEKGEAENEASTAWVKPVVRRRPLDASTLPAANAQELPVTPH
jgi:hypothetical protein